MTLLAYRFALDPAPFQERDLRSHAGATRKVFNWGLARIKVNLSQREAEKSYGITDPDLTAVLSWSLYSLRNLPMPGVRAGPRSGCQCRP
jgi:putative transposase